MNNNQWAYILKIILLILLPILIVLFIILGVLSWKLLKTKLEENKKRKLAAKREKGESATAGYNKQSIFDFMEFEKVEDNMIIQKNKKYLMIIECQGINYDLMSGIEKVSVEQGFIQFLNTLRQSIQIYTQTRAVNLGTSINTYKSKVDDIGKKLTRLMDNYDAMLNSEREINQDEIQKLQYEIIKQRNLYEYGVDIVNNTERMSLNRNILRKYYYIVVPYYSEGEVTGKYDSEELKGMAFSELYTNCQSMIQSLGGCGIHCKILNSRELVDLLYVAYNRDESEVYELDKMLKSGYTELYTTSEDVTDKKMRELDKIIKDRAKALANSVVKDVIAETTKERQAKQKEKNIEKLAQNEAKKMINNSVELLGDELTEKSIEKIEELQYNEREERKNENTEIKKTRKIRRKQE
jgi:hypothetical protein